MALSDSSPKIRVWLGIITLFVVGLIYAQAVQAPFVYDDYPHFVENQKLLTPQSISDIFQSGHQETRPLYNLSLSVQAYFFGTDPVAAHLINLFLFAGCLLLFLYLLLGLTQCPFTSLIATLLFALHPLAVESVAYVNSTPGFWPCSFLFSPFISCVDPNQFT